MTWPQALPVLIIAGIFDLLRMFFEQFWFFGPALAAVATNVAADGGTFGKAAGVTVGFLAGTAGAPVIEMLGVVMAMAVGLMGFLALGIWILKTNARIFKVNASGSLWFVGGFGLSEIPFLGTIPAFSLVLWKLYRTQIRVEKAAFKKHMEEERALMQARSAQMTQAEIY